MSQGVRDDVPLAPLTTLGLGGPARHFLAAGSADDVRAGLAWARARGLPAFILGGGSNLIVPDAGFAGLVVQLDLRGVDFAAPDASGAVLCTAAAGEPWDDLVAATVARDLAGLECLSGIPGTVGATPVQNVGAYGQEVAETIRSVRVLDRARDAIVDLSAADCAFAYRDSRFKRAPDAHVVLAVTFALRPHGPPTLRYAELRAAVTAAAASAPTLAEVRHTVIALRRRKSMVIDRSDPNRRSVGSFFMNPVVDDATLADVVARAHAAGLIAAPADLPRFAAGPGRHKLAAAWLIEKAGFPKGTRRGAVGLSSNHALALVHHGGGRTADLLAFAREIRAGVAACFGVTLVPEPVVLGAAGPDPLTLPG